MSTETDIIETPGQRRARQKRAAAERARQYRLRKKNERMPLPRDVDAAWTEATCFWMTKRGNELRAAGLTGGTLEMPIYTVITIAVGILERQGNSRKASKLAVVDRLRPRQEHEHPDNVPSIEPRVDATAPTRQPKMGTDWDNWTALLDDMLEA